MNTSSEEKRASLFTIEQVSPLPSPISQLSGCALCEHCTLLRLLLRSRLDQCPNAEGMPQKAQEEGA